MKKITILLFAFALILGNAAAQKKWKIGATLGPTLSKYQYSDGQIATFPDAGSKYGLGLSTGVNFYRLFGKNFMFKTGIHYNLKNYQLHSPVVNDYVDIHRSSSFVTLPLGFQYNFKIKQQSFFVNTGMDLSWFYKSVDKTDTESYTNHYNSWNPVTELYFGIGYMYKFNEKYTFFVNPQYSPKIFTDDYSTFKLNFGVIFKY